MIAVIDHEHVHAADADPERLEARRPSAMLGTNLALISGQRAFREPRREAAGLLAERMGLRDDREARTHVREQARQRRRAPRGRPSASACDEIAATIASAASRQRPTCSWRRQAKNEGAQVSFWP